MNIRVSIAIFILLSFLNMGAISNDINNENSFKSLEKNVSNISEFEENGVKLQYKIKTEDNVEKEILRVKKYLIQSINGSCKEIEENQVEISNGDMNINVKMWYESKYNYVEIILLNKNPKYSTSYLKDILKKVENGKLENVEYFFYYNGKQKDEKNIYTIDKLIDENSLERVESLEINNGSTGLGYLRNGYKVNFALIKYNTGSHIIIGTPIIFTTY